jgi:maltose O-acetyltransferase
MDNWFIKKIENQLTKLTKLLYHYKLNRFKKTLKHCGEGTFIQFPVRFEGAEHISIGNDASINAFVHMWGHGGITIGNDCLIASHVSINSLTHDTGISPYKNGIVQKAVNIGNNVWIGSHVVILPGITIGDNAIVGAGAVVNKNVPPNVTIAGVPAKIIKSHIE